jgi:hypothetical protein
MGLFDSFYDADDAEWQTKALGSTLETFRIGDRVTAAEVDFQIEVINGSLIPKAPAYTNHAFATIRDGLFEAITTERDHSMYLLGYQGPIHNLTPEDEAHNGDNLRRVVRQLDTEIRAARNRDDFELADTLLEVIALLER